ARVIMDKFSGRSKGFGFVEMSSGAEAQKAIQALNGTEFDGRNITVNEARPQERRSAFGGDRRGGGGGGRNRWQLDLLRHSKLQAVSLIVARNCARSTKHSFLFKRDWVHLRSFSEND